MKNLSRVCLILCLSFCSSFACLAQTSLLWSESAGTSASSQKSFVATDLLGNIYMASSVNGTYGLDWKVSSWRPDSMSRWTYTYNGAGNQDDIPAAIFVDSSFSVFVAGTIKASGSNDIRVIKLDSAGNLKWGTNYNRTGSAQDVATGLAVSGNKLWVCGYSQQSTSNYDYTLLKYDTAGALSWSRHANGSGNGDDYCTAFAVKSSGDAFITGDAVTNATGSPRDMMTLRYLNDGTLSWTKYYGNTIGQHDYGKAIGINASGDIIIGGQSFVTTSNSNLITIKYSASNGTQAWASSYAGAYGGHDAGVALVIDPDNYFYITCFTQTGISNYDYVTIKYKGNDQLTWAQTYNGPGNGIDEACAIIHDGDDVVITGKSTGSGTGFDVCTISMMKSSGSVNWSLRVDEIGSMGDYGIALARDEMGNISVSARSQTGSTSFLNLTLKINQSVKNAAAIRMHMEMLADGVLSLVSDTASKRILFDAANLCVDSFHKVFLGKYLLSCDQQSVNARTLVRSSISSTYGLPSSMPWEKILDRRVYSGSVRKPPMIYIPGFETFTRSGFINNMCEAAFAHGEADYPIYDVPSNNPLYETDLITTPTLTLIAQPAPWWHKYAPFLRFCYASLNTTISGQCNVCSGFIPADGLPADPTPPGCQQHELGIRLGMDYAFDASNIPNPDGCIYLENLSGNPILNPHFGMLTALPGYHFYERTGTVSYMTVKKIPYPIFDVNGQQFGVSMTLCENDADPQEIDFNDYHGTAASNYTEDYAIGWGGIYKVTHPGINTRPVYFAFPFAKYLRYGQGPDINIYYSLHDAGQLCGNGKYEVGEEFFTGCCDFCITTEASYGISANQARDILVTTDYSTISSYWLDNAVTVAFHGLNQVQSMNHSTFYAVSGPTPCSPASYYFPLSLPAPLCEMNLLSDGRYEILDALTASCNPGDDLLIHVLARFSNGESIDQCQTVTLGGSGTISHMSVEFRGGINDYSATQTNYRVAVYLLP